MIKHDICPFYVEWIIAASTRSANILRSRSPLSWGKRDHSWQIGHRCTPRPPTLQCWSSLFWDAGTRQSPWLPKKWGTLVGRRMIQLRFGFIPTEWIYRRAVESCFDLAVACTWHIYIREQFHELRLNLHEFTLIEERASWGYFDTS